MSLTRIPQEIEQQAAYWYVRLRSPELTAQQESEFFAWLESSSLHQAAFVRMDQAWAAGGTFQLPSKRSAVASNRQIGFGLSAAATVLIAVVMVYLFPLNQKDAVSAFEKYTALTEQRTIKLPDQSSIVLSPNSHIEVDYSGTTRELHLHKGQIFLNVTQDVQRAFKVITDQGVIRVIGTQFAVQQLSEDLKITVVDGLVGLIDPDGTNSDNKPILVLSKNQQILYSEALKGTAAITVDAARETSWTKGRMIFDGAPLAEVIAILNQHLSLPIHIASPELETKRIVGAISVKNPKAAAASLASIAGAVVEDAPNKDALILKSISNDISRQ